MKHLEAVPFLERLLSNIVLVAVVLFTQRDCEVVSRLRSDPAVRSAPNMSGLDFPTAAGRVVLNTGAVVTADVLKE